MQVSQKQILTEEVIDLMSNTPESIHIEDEIEESNSISHSDDRDDDYEPDQSQPEKKKYIRKLKKSASKGSNHSQVRNIQIIHKGEAIEIS